MLILLSTDRPRQNILQLCGAMPGPAQCGSPERGPAGSFLEAAVVSQRRTVNVREDGTLQIAGSVGLILPNPMDLCLLQPQLLQHGRHLALFVQKSLPVVTTQHYKTANRRENSMKESSTESSHTDASRQSWHKDAKFM